MKSRVGGNVGRAKNENEREGSNMQEKKGTKGRGKEKREANTREEKKETKMNEGMALVRNIEKETV